MGGGRRRAPSRRNPDWRGEEEEGGRGRKGGGEAGPRGRLRARCQRGAGMSRERWSLGLAEKREAGTGGRKLKPAARRLRRGAEG